MLCAGWFPFSASACPLESNCIRLYVRHQFCTSYSLYMCQTSIMHARLHHRYILFILTLLNATSKGAFFPADKSSYQTIQYILTRLGNKTQQYLNCFIWGPSWSEQCTVFQGRTTASHLEVLNLMPASSHMAANRASACWRSQSGEANGTKSSKSSAERRTRPCVVSSPQLHLG